MPQSGETILSHAEERFGPNGKPKAVLLTHCHFGALVKLIERREVLVNGYKLEFPFLTGKNNYPDSDPSLEGGALAKIPHIYPIEPNDI
jgi:hypothetical protein